MSEKEILKLAREAIRDGRLAEAAALATHLVDAGDPWNIAGYLYRATAYENGGPGIDADLDKAISDYMKLSFISPGREVYLYLANALISRGGDGFDRAYGYLKEAEKYGTSPGLNLAFARYYEEARCPNISLACRYFFYAAAAGRFLGFFGLSRGLRKNGRPALAFLVDMTRYLLGPFIALLIGRKAQHRF